MRCPRLVVLLAAIAGAALGASPAHASHQTDKGWVHTGVGSEDEARAYPCPTAEAGGWERTGPVVCFEKMTPQWKLDYDAPGTGCSYYPQGGWRGSCVFDLDMGDHVKVWGTRGIPYTPFTLTWLHGQQAAPPASGGSSGAPPSDDASSRFEVEPVAPVAPAPGDAGTSGVPAAGGGTAAPAEFETQHAAEAPRLESSAGAADGRTSAHGTAEPGHGHEGEASRGSSPWLVLVLGGVAAGTGGALLVRRRRTNEAIRSSPDGDPLA